MSVELSVVRVPGVDIEACRRVAERIGAEFKVREYRGPPELLDAIARLLVA